MEVNDIVFVKGAEGKTFGKITEVMVAGWGNDYRVFFPEDGSSIVANGYLLEKINYLEFIAGHCPSCGNKWKETTGFMTVYKDCLKCNLKEEDVRKDHYRKIASQKNQAPQP